jgi:hypothetical protein
MLLLTELGIAIRWIKEWAGGENSAEIKTAVLQPCYIESEMN